jgi:hypothetical protein
VKILRKVVVTSVFVVPMILSAQIVVQGMGIKLITQTIDYFSNQGFTPSED